MQTQALHAEHGQRLAMRLAGRACLTFLQAPRPFKMVPILQTQKQRRPHPHNPTSWPPRTQQGLPHPHPHTPALPGPAAAPLQVPHTFRESRGGFRPQAAPTRPSSARAGSRPRPAPHPAPPAPPRGTADRGPRRTCPAEARPPAAGPRPPADAPPLGRTAIAARAPLRFRLRLVQTARPRPLARAMTSHAAPRDAPT